MARKITYNKLHSLVTPKSKRLFTITRHYIKNPFSGTVYLVDKNKVAKTAI